MTISSGTLSDDKKNNSTVGTNYLIPKSEVKVIQFTGNVIAPEDSNDLFYMFTKVKSIQGDLNTSQVTDMSGMFGGLRHVETIEVSNFDTSKVTTINYTFYET